MKNTETNEGNDKLEYDGITTSEILDKGHSKDHTSTSKFLRSLYGNEFDTGHLVLWTKPDKKSHFFAGNEMDKAAETAMFMADLMDVITVSVFRKRFQLMVVVVKTIRSFAHRDCG